MGVGISYSNFNFSYGNWSAFTKYLKALGFDLYDFLKYDTDENKQQIKAEHCLTALAQLCAVTSQMQDDDMRQRAIILGTSIAHCALEGKPFEVDM